MEKLGIHSAAELVLGAVRPGARPQPRIPWMPAPAENPPARQHDSHAGDGQYDVGELPLLLARARPQIGLVNGYKLERHDPWHPILIGRAYNALARTLFRIRIRDIDCDFRLIRRDLLKDLRLTSTSGTICVKLVRKLELSGCGAIEVGVRHLPRLHGRSQFFRVRSLLSTFAQLLRLHPQLVIQSAIFDPHRWPVLVRCRAAAGRLWKQAV
jgi:hypothetical protein